MEDITVPCHDTLTTELSSKDETQATFMADITVQPDDSLGAIHFHSSTKEVFRITHDRKVIVSGDYYEAAQTFWDIVKQYTPEGYTVEKGPTPAQE